jgi:outer membrane protein TolC
MKKTGVLLLATLLWQFQSIAQQRSFTLAEAQAFALENAYSVKDKELELEKTKQLIKEVAAMGLPQVNGNVGFTNYLDIPVQVVPNFINDALPVPDPNAPEFIAAKFGVNYNSSVGIGVQQLVFDGSYIVGLMATRVAKDLSIRDLEKSKIEIQEAVAQAYHGVITLESTQEVLEKNLTFLNQNLIETQKLYEAGFLEAQDADQFELLVSSVQNSLLNVNNQLLIARKMLNYQMGMDVNAEIGLTDNITTLLANFGDGEGILSEQFVLERNIDYRTIEVQQRASLLQKRREQMEYLPKLNAGFNYSQNYFSNEYRPFESSESWFPTQFWNLGLQVPIFSGGRRMARVAQARFDMDRLEIAKIQVSDGLRLEYEQAKANYTYSLANYKTQERNVALAARIRDRSTIKFREGLETSLDLTQAQNQLLDNQRQLIQAGSELLNARTRLEKLNGKYNR